jgi:GMP synthase (glutamine-hydrolysing)
VKKILVVDNTFDPPHGCPEIQACLREAAAEFGKVEISFVRAPDSGIPRDLSGFDGVVLSGSKTRIEESAPWIDLEIAAIRELHRLRIPTFGICYGEQLIARSLGGESCAGVAATYEYGWAEVELKGNSPLFEGLPSRFHTFEFHSDEVNALPAGFRLTASSPACPVQAFDVEGVPMWGVQFHPERGLEKGNEGLIRKQAENFQVLNRDRGPELYDPAVGRTIFRNFLRIVWSK